MGKTTRKMRYIAVLEAKMEKTVLEMVPRKENGGRAQEDLEKKTGLTGRREVPFWLSASKKVEKIVPENGRKRNVE